MLRNGTEFVWVHFNNRTVLVERSTNRKGPLSARLVGAYPELPAATVADIIATAKDRSTTCKPPKQPT